MQFSVEVGNQTAGAEAPEAKIVASCIASLTVCLTLVAIDCVTERQILCVMRCWKRCNWAVKLIL